MKYAPDFLMSILGGGAHPPLLIRLFARLEATLISLVLEHPCRAIYNLAGQLVINSCKHGSPIRCCWQPRMILFATKVVAALHDGSSLKENIGRRIGGLLWLLI